MYASESDLSDSDKDEEEEKVTATKGKRRGRDFAARIRLDDDEPMDLLSGAASRFTSEQQQSLFSLATKEVTNLLYRCKRSPSIQEPSHYSLQNGRRDRQDGY